MKKTIIENRAIAASAGSGKTFQLAHRYIKLQANGVPPERIIALTFSRKAAGEIFDSIVKYLTEAASSAGAARETAGRIGVPGMGMGDFLKLLRGLLSRLNRLNVGTLDSFTVRVVRTFPIELGISTEFRLMDNDGAAAEDARREVLSRLFNYRLAGAAAQRNFVEAFKQATFGQEEKRLQDSFDTFTGRYHDYYRLLPARGAWGLEEVIWPDGNPWLERVRDPESVAEELMPLLEGSAFPVKMLESFGKIIEFARGYNARALWDSSLSKNIVFERLLEHGEALKRGACRIKYHKKEYTLDRKQCRLLYTLLRHIVGTELRRAMQRTRGIWEILNQYEELYDTMVRRRGRLTFADTQYLLTESNRHSGGILLSRMPDQEARLFIDYRLDSELDHWLLDEFQDTSDLQWEAIATLIDEIVQDDSGRRSFFYVGDVKQAIYNWRGGNSRLFAAILNKYGGRIGVQPLDESFRSCQPIIDTVNKVFAGLPGEVLPEGAVGKWKRIWRKHRCNEDNVPGSGYVALLEPPPEEGGKAPSVEDRYECVARLLREIEPLKRGLSVAVLVRTNDSGKEIVNILRSECPEMPIVHEGKAAIKDNPVVGLLLSLVKFAAHPGDTYAWRHIEMSPLKRYLARKEIDRERLPLMLLREIYAEGFQGFIRRWGERLHGERRLDDYGRKRLEDLVRAAIEFDEEGSRDVHAFLRFIKNYEMDELAAAGAVRVMTIHQAKGLGFDIVILPDLQGKKARNITRARGLDFLVARDPGSSLPLWALKMPRRLIAECDPVLSGYVAAADEMACFDELCVLYVAMTRARHALYIVSSFPGPSSKSVESASLVKMQLAGDPKPVDGPRVTIDGEEFIRLYEAGDPRWYIKERGKEEGERRDEARDIPDDFFRKPSRRKRLVRVSPSEKARESQNAGSLFSLSTGEGMSVGSALHELFSRVEWSDGTDVEEVVKGWRESSPATGALKEKAVGHFRRACASREFRRALVRPGGDVDLWREKRFEIVIDNQWITGAFDRVVIARDESGKPVSAEILDYKSDDVSGDNDMNDAAERYRPQLELYRDALSRMLPLDSSNITLRLFFTQPCKIYELE